MNDVPERAARLELPALDPAEVADHRELWCRALESGHYPQVRNRLRTPLGYCCLGVAETLRNAEWRCRRDYAGTDRLLDPADVADDAATYATNVVEYYLLNERIYLTDPATGEQLVRPSQHALAERPLYVGDPNQQTGTMLSGRGARWLGLVETDPYVAVYSADAWRCETLSVLNDLRKFNFPQIAAVIRDQPATWTGASVESSKVVVGYLADNRPPPSYVAAGA